MQPPLLTLSSTMSLSKCNTKQSRREQNKAKQSNTKMEGMYLSRVVSSLVELLWGGAGHFADHLVCGLGVCSDFFLEGMESRVRE